MVKLNKVKPRAAKRLGRGYGSGKGGHTSSRGQKGQKARRTIGVLFEGLKMRKSIIKRLPFRRGKDKFKSLNQKPVIIDISLLDSLASGTVNLDTLVMAGIVSKSEASKYGVKILGNSEVKKKFSVELPISKSAASQIEKAGGTISVSSKPDARNSKQIANSKS